MRHVGVRPEHLPLERAESKKKRVTYYENFPDGSYKIWNTRQLNSGCNSTLTDPETDGNLIYCYICKAWFHENQFTVGGG